MHDSRRKKVLGTTICYRCPDCEHAVRRDLSVVGEQAGCPHCGRALAAPAQAMPDGQIHRCLVCSSTDLFVRKDFPQRLGVALVVLGLGASCVTWYYHQVEWTFGILFATAFVDVLLYVLMSDVLECYRCHAQYRQVSNLQQHGPFALETQERYRQQAARGMGQGSRPVTTPRH